MTEEITAPTQLLVQTGQSVAQWQEALEENARLISRAIQAVANAERIAQALPGAETEAFLARCRAYLDEVQQREVTLQNGLAEFTRIHETIKKLDAVWLDPEETATP
jgi:hypothetical protein